MTRVLVVDDHPDSAYYLRALLSAHGFEVETASDGAEALCAARRSPPAVVISDLLMPVMDGYTLLRQWRDDERLRDTPFVVYTATYTEPQDESLALRFGATTFLRKPAEPVELLECVQSVLARREPRRDYRAPVDEADALREYSDTLVRKLERKSVELTAVNQRLREDIASRERAEAALRESEERFRQLADNVDEVFWLVDAAGEAALHYVSPAYERVWGRSCQSLYDAPRSWTEGVHPDDVDAVVQSIPTTPSGAWEQTFRVVRPDGELRWVRARGYPVRDASGRVFRMAGVSRDITEYRRLEEQFRQAHRLEGVGRLAGGVAHDFNNLLSVILSYSTLLCDEVDDSSPLRADLEEIRRAGERARDLTRQLLAFSRQQAVEARVLDLGAVVRDMEKMLRRLLGEDITLTLSAPEQAARVHADSTQIEQIVINLAVNARDAMPQGGTLDIAVRHRHLDADEGRPRIPPGCYVTIAVADNGCGMDAATRERIFEPFFTTKELGKGTGLGLSTVFGIVSQSHGHVVVESEPGQGAKFEVFLPCTDRIEARALAPHASPTEGPATLRGDETILLVEDDDQVRASNRAILCRHGYVVLDARNGGEALLVSEKFDGAIDLLLTDVVMPWMNGGELANRLRANRPEMRVLHVSGHAPGALIELGILVRGAPFLQKPIVPDALLRKVRDVLR